MKLPKLPPNVSKPLRALPTLFLALLALSACDIVTQAPVNGPEPAVPATDIQQETTEGVELVPAATPGRYDLSFQGTNVQFMIHSNYTDRYGVCYLNATWWGQNRGKPNMSILQYWYTGDRKWHTVGGDPYLQNGYITANYGILPNSDAGGFPYNTNSRNNPMMLSGPVYWRICTVGNFTNMPLTCGQPIWLRF